MKGAAIAAPFFWGDGYGRRAKRANRANRANRAKRRERKVER